MKDIALVAEMEIRDGLKSRWGNTRVGSTPTERTILDSIVWIVSGTGALEQKNGTIKEFLEYDMVRIPQ